MTIDADPVGMGFATRRALNFEGVVVWSIYSVCRSKIRYTEYISELVPPKVEHRTRLDLLSRSTLAF